MLYLECFRRVCYLFLGLLFTTKYTNMPSSSSNEALEAALQAMSSGKNCFDVTIICTTDDHQAEYWMDRFRQGLLKKDHSADATSAYPMVLAVSEDWNDSGGAGNGLGTLYAFQKAAALAEKRYKVDLNADLGNAKVSAALFHTAGKGTRLAPMPASENNNKPGVVSCCCCQAVRSSG